LAQAELDRIRGATRTKTYVVPKRQTLREYVEKDWLPTIKMTVAESTWSSYRRNLMVHVLPRIGGLQLADVTPDVLDRMYADLRESGHRGHDKGGPLSVRSTRYVHTIIGRALGDAVRKGRLYRNAAAAASPPRARDAKTTAKQAMHTWEAGVLDDFLRRSEASRYQPAWLFLATSGCRRGEALGLVWSALDLDTGRCALRQTITAVDHKPHTADRSKTDDGRTIELDRKTVSALRALKARQAQEKLSLGAGYSDSGFAFCHPDGRAYHPERFSREFDRMVKRLGVPRIRLHDLRHSWATLALRAGVPIKVVSERLGHSTTAITADVYSHVTPGMQTDAAEKVAALIFGS
jgi:integrase